MGKDCTGLSAVEIRRASAPYIFNVCLLLSIAAETGDICRISALVWIKVMTQ
jgi:hypothetical protein